MAAFRLSWAAGDTGIELDVTMTADRRIVVIHDDSVDRTTNGSGPVAGMTLAQLRRLDAGRWFGESFSGEPIPLLTDVLDELPAGGLVNVEVKASAWRDDPHDGIEGRLLQLVDAASLTGSVLFSSFDWRILERLRERSPGIALGVLVDASTGASESRRAADALGAWSIHPPTAAIAGGTPPAYRSFSGRIYPYTVADASIADSVLAAGAHGYFADLPFGIQVDVDPGRKSPGTY